MMKKYLVCTMIALTLLSCSGPKKLAVEPVAWQPEANVEDTSKVTLKYNFGGGKIDLMSFLKSAKSYADTNFCLQQGKTAEVSEETPVKVYSNSTILQIPIECTAANEKKETRSMQLIHIDG